MFKKVFVVLAMIGLLAPSFAFAKWGLEEASQGTGLISQGANVSKDAIPNLIGDIVGVALSFVGAIFFILILYAGFLWMTAFGGSEKVDKAKDILLHAVIGLIIVLAAYAISKFIFSNLPGGGQAAPTQPTGKMGCCSNPNTGLTVQTLEQNCKDQNRKWLAGECEWGCCINSDNNTRTQTTEPNCVGDNSTWVVGLCRMPLPL